MKKKALYVLVVLLVLGGMVAGASAYAGRAVTTRLSQHTLQFGKLIPALKVQEQIEHGLFRSTRAVKLQLGCVPVPSGDGQTVGKSAPVEVHWRDTIHHVPSLQHVAVVDSELSITGEAERLFGTRTPLTIRTQIAFDGQFDSDAKLASIKLQPKPGDQLDFSGIVLHLKGKLPEGGGTFSFSGNTEPMRVSAKAEDGSFTAAFGKTDLTGTMTFDPNAPTFLLPYRTETRVSELTFQVATPSADGAEPKQFDLAFQRVTATAESKIAKELLTNDTKLVGAVKAAGFAIDKFELATSVRNLHVPTLTKLMQATVGKSFSCDQPAQPLEAAMAEFEALADMAFELLPHNPEYQVGPIAIELGGHRAELGYTVGVHGVAAGVAPPPLMELLMKHGFARAEASMHLGLIDKLAACCSQPGAAAEPNQVAASLGLARMMLDSFVEQGFIEREGETIRGRFELDGGELKLNGKPFELPGLGALGGQDAMQMLMQQVAAPDEEPADGVETGE